MALQLSEEDLVNEEVLASKLVTLAEIVVRKHFYASVSEKDDLVSIGVLKALSMIGDQKFVKSKGNFASFLYTGMRNDMHNYLYHQNKFNTVDIDDMAHDIVDESAVCNVEMLDEYSIEYSLIHIVCMRFAPLFGDFIEGQVIDCLRASGFSIVGMRADYYTHLVSYCNNDILKDSYSEDVRDDVIGRLVGLILWKKREHDGV